VNHRDEVRQFLTTRRAKITPQQAGLSAYGTRRRVAGLRREEVATLAGVSIEYYARVERGNLAGVSEPVLDAIARALQLDDAERAHLFDLARTANTSSAKRAPRRAQQVRPGIQRVLDTAIEAAAFVRNGRMDIVAANALARAFYSPVLENPANRANFARHTFLDPTAERFYDDWQSAADITVAILRTEAGQDPYNRELTELVGELSTRSEQFRVRWAAHDVRLHQSGVKCFHHPVVGELTVHYESMPLPADPGLNVTFYTTEPGTASHDAFRLLASWAATERAPLAGTGSPADDGAEHRAG
jgi:transcriptional regulator with XRE-family HTH domain